MNKCTRWISIFLTSVTSTASAMISIHPSNVAFGEIKQSDFIDNEKKETRKYRYAISIPNAKGSGGPMQFCLRNNQVEWLLLLLGKKFSWKDCLNMSIDKYTYLFIYMNRDIHKCKTTVRWVSLFCYWTDSYLLASTHINSFCLSKQKCIFPQIKTYIKLFKKRHRHIIHMK